MKRILICEDEPDAVESISAFLKRKHYDVAIALDGQEALRLAETFQPHLVLLDIRMPKLNGLEVVQEIRKFNTSAKIIFVTAFQSPGLSTEAALYDIVDYIIKPATMDDILKAVHTALPDGP